MFKENTFYKAKKDFSLSLDRYENGRIQVFKDEILFIVSVEYNKRANLYAIGLIKDFKFHNTFWGKFNMIELTDEL